MSGDEKDQTTTALKKVYATEGILLPHSLSGAVEVEVPLSRQAGVLLYLWLSLKRISTAIINEFFDKQHSAGKTPITQKHVKHTEKKN